MSIYEYFFLLDSQQFNIYFFSRFRLLLFFQLVTSLIFLLPRKASYKKFHSLNKIFLQNNSELRNAKCDWCISVIQVGRNRAHRIFEKFYHTNICTSSLYEFAISHSQTS